MLELLPEDIVFMINYIPFLAMLILMFVSMHGLRKNLYSPVAAFFGYRDWLPALFFLAFFVIERLMFGLEAGWIFIIMILQGTLISKVSDSSETAVMMERLSLMIKRANEGLDENETARLEVLNKAFSGWERWHLGGGV